MGITMCVLTLVMSTGVILPDYMTLRPCNDCLQAGFEAVAKHKGVTSYTCEVVMAENECREGRHVCDANYIPPAP